MQFLRRNPSICHEDLNLLTFGQGTTKVFSITSSDGDILASKGCILRTENDWLRWFGDERFLLRNKQGINLASFPSYYLHRTPKILTKLSRLCLRRDTNSLDPAVLQYMPFTKTVFDQLVQKFFVHGSIVRAINRSTSCLFDRRFFTWSEPSQISTVYNCRSTGPFSSDLALAVTFFPKTLLTHAVMFGCDDGQSEEIIARLTRSDEQVFHPMILPAMFAEIERQRIIPFVRNHSTSVLQRIYAESAQNDPILNHTSTVNTKSSINPWVNLSELRNGMQSFRRQMEKMVEHVDELESIFFELGQSGDFETTAKCPKEHLDALQDSGRQIKTRVTELIDEYDEYIRKCTTLMDGMNLATQLGWNKIGRQDALINHNISRSNLDVAHLMRKDGNLMKSIAILTMVFLPATFVAV